MIRHPFSDQVISANFPDVSPDQFKARVASISDVESFQKKVIRPVLINMLENTSTGLSTSGPENLNKASGVCTFISNHRDITLDPSLLNLVLVDNGFSTAEVAIGDNLLQNDWIKDLVRINKSFIVYRDLPPRELVRASQKLSSYIYYTLRERKQSVWIAQREGRAKDGNDKTQPGIFHMLAMAAQGDLLKHFEDYNILPMVISYEHDPCDADKVWSLYAHEYLGGYEKSEKEDQLAMQKGIEGQKGHIHIHFGKPLSEDIRNLPYMKHKQDIIHALCELIDREIILNYRTWPTNHIAIDLLNNDEKQSAYYNSEQREAFVETIEKKISMLKGEKKILRSMLYHKYARPLINKQAMLNGSAKQM